MTLNLGKTLCETGKIIKSDLGISIENFGLVIDVLQRMVLNLLLTGNILLSALTNVDNKTKYELAVDMEDWSDNRRFARYRSFRLGNEVDKFRLYHQNLYYGNSGDSLHSHNGLPFSTFDVDNDSREGDFVDRSCARLYKVLVVIVVVALSQQSHKLFLKAQKPSTKCVNYEIDYYLSQKYLRITATGIKNE